MMSNSQNFKSLFFDTEIKEAVVSTLISLRSIEHRLSEISIDKRAYKYLKQMGVFGEFSKHQGWQSFNLFEQTILAIVDELWNYGFEAQTIKGVVDHLYDDSLVREQVNTFIKSEKGISKESERPNFYDYINEQTVINPSLPPITNIEAILVLVLFYNSSASFVFPKGGSFHFDFAESLSEVAPNLFKQTYLCISITEIFNSRFKQKVPQEQLLGSHFIVINDSLKSSIESLDSTMPIVEHIKKHSQQDIFIKVRNSKVVSIKRQILKQDKQ